MIEFRNELTKSVHVSFDLPFWNLELVHRSFGSMKMYRESKNIPKSSGLIHGEGYIRFELIEHNTVYAYL